jgi:DNA-binding CsgD family transcriptional regulator
VAPLPVDLAVGLAFLGAGIAAWRQRPRNRIGPLMILTAGAWFGQHLADIFTNLFLALVAHQVLVFPYGVTRDRLERALVWTSYALAIVGYLVSEIWTATNEPLATLAIPLFVAILFAVVRRWLLASPPERRALEPIVWAGPPVLIVAAIAVAHDYLDVGSSAVDWLKLVYVALPLAFLAGVLRTQLSRAAVGDLVVALGGATSPGAIRDALARTLGDPSLELESDSDGGVTIVHDPSLDPELVRSAEAAARLAFENARMHAELKARIETKPKPLAGLTPRELEVLALIADGRTDRGIARELYVTPKTVEAHIRSIFRKLDLPADAALENRRVHAVLAFLRSQA